MLPPSAIRPLARRIPPAAARSPCCRRTFIVRARKGASDRRGALDTLNVERLSQESRDYHRTRRNFLAAGAVAGIVSFVFTAWKLKQALSTSNATKLDSPLPPADPLHDGRRKVVVHDDEGNEIVRTGNSTVPELPRTITLPEQSRPAPPPPPADEPLPSVTAPTLVVPPDAAGAGAETEYTLVGYGVRTVSFLSIQVYVVGYYIATADIAALQARLVRRVNPIASTLVAAEKDELRAALLDPADSEAVWNELLAAGVPARSVFRVVPVRDTDFPHLRDGFVRAIQANADKAAADDAAFGEAMREFRRIFNRGKVPKRKQLLLARGADGGLAVLYDEGGKKGSKHLIGSVADERVSRALWLNYLAGKKVASEPARKSIVDGILEFVERPVGTVAAQVV